MLSAALLLLLAGSLGDAEALSQRQSDVGPAYMVADLTQGASTPLNPSGIVALNGVAYFSGQGEAGSRSRPTP